MCNPHMVPPYAGCGSVAFPYLEYAFPASYLTSSVASKLDLLQFAYKSNRGTDDAVLTLLNTVTKHLTNPKGYARILFIDFSSAFNSMCCFLFLLMNLQLMRKMSDYSNMLMIWPWLACWTKQIRHMIWPT